MQEAQEARAAAEAACGLTKALADAEQASSEVSARLGEILAYPFEGISEVQQVAGYLTDCLDWQEGVTSDTILAFVEALAGRATA